MHLHEWQTLAIDQSSPGQASPISQPFAAIMTSTTPSHYPSEPQSEAFIPPLRPKFNSQNTSDRLREGAGRLPSFSMISNINKGRRSLFRETGLLEDESSYTAYTEQAHHEKERSYGEATELTSESRKNISEDNEDSRASSSHQDQDSTLSRSASAKQPWYAKLTSGRRPRVQSAAAAPPNMSGVSRFTMIALLIAVVLPGFGYNNGRRTVEISGANAGVIRNSKYQGAPILDIRADSPTKICTRWSHQTALLNGTLYMYGGQAKSTGDQTQNTWNNNLVTLDLTKSWDTQSPALKGLPQPNGPPAVANAYLWNDYNNLYLYGGECAENPKTSPAPLATWKYTPASGTWKEYPNPKTSSGKYSTPGDLAVQRSAEGAGISVPELGLSWYFGGHLDWATTPGWTEMVARVFLKSLLEFTHPGYVNENVDALTTTGADEGGAYRNITESGLQTDEFFSERADGVLVFVPGWGESGVLIGLAGGKEPNSFSNDFSQLDVYDIKNSKWYHQQAKGDMPSVRVNPCAVIASAPDASSFNIYLYAGQNLQPFKSQTQYNDMYILSIPSFTWIRVPDQPNAPAPRAGHTCNLRDGQMIVVGGYVGTSIPCDSPGIYVFNATSLQWQTSFTALSPKPDLHPDNSVLAASFGYKVPDQVAKAIGGNANGGATVTTPAMGVTAGPFATGKPPIYTITAASSTATVTWGPDATNAAAGGNGNGGGGGATGGKASPGLIAAGVIAGLAGFLAGYLGFCAWLYRRQVKAYRTHLAVVNRYSGPAASKASFGGIAALFGRKGSKESRKNRPAARKMPAMPTEKDVYGHYGGHGRYESTSTADSFAWVGREDPKAAWLSDEPTPGSGTTGTSSGAGRKYSGVGSRGEERPFGWYGTHGQGSGSGSGSQAAGRIARRNSDSGGSTSSTEGLLDGQELSFFSVVMGPRRTLRVINGLEEGERGTERDERDEHI